MKLSKFLVAPLMIALLLPLYPVQPKASAASASDWRSGRIIEDSYFSDKNSMSVQQIQNFLNGLMPSCDTNGTKTSELSGGVDYNGDGRISRAEWAQAKGYATKFTCLRDYYEVPKTAPSTQVPANNYGGLAIPQGAVSSAQMIYNAAQQYSISPKVLIVTIHKESSGPLTTDDWPLLKQYTYAMGAHCPDSGPGGSANCDANYAGFSIQIAESAKLLRGYLDNMTQPWWPYKKPFQTNYVLWNIQPSNCGGSNIFINTKATAALYTYTPYQPNQAALNNMYGTGDGCSAYGNRNFWRIYTDWFGSPTYGYVIPSWQSNYAQTACAVPRFSADYVGRLYQPDTRDYLYTTSYDESCVAVRMGYIWDGIVFKNDKDVPNSMPIYRLSGQDRHVFTSSIAVRDDFVQNQKYNDEGIGFYALGSSSPETIPVVGLQKDFTFYFTSSGKEAEISSNQGFHNFGTIFYTTNLSSQTKAPVYRVTRNNSRLYTTDIQEKQAALQNHGFSDEGVITYNDSYPNPSNAPLYRLRSPTGDYFYTMDRYERDAAVVLYGYYSEGVGFYTLLYSNSPAYRAVEPRSARRIFTNSMLEYQLAMSRYNYRGEGVGWYGYDQ